MSTLLLEPPAPATFAGTPFTEPPVWEVVHGIGPLVSTAIHEGHYVRPEVAARINLDPLQRMREEDPYTEYWTAPAGTRIVGRRSRFEVDLNRPRASAVYQTPEDAWGLDIWKEPLPDDVIAESLAEYDAFYAMLQKELKKLAARNRRVLVLDMHTYNHVRGGWHTEPADPIENPDVNLGTGTMDRERWAPVVDTFLETMNGMTVVDRELDVRENVKFFGGNMARWIHETFPETVCVLSVEFKKFFMDEWTGAAKMEYVDGIRRAVEETVDPVLAALEAL